MDILAFQRQSNSKYISVIVPVYKDLKGLIDTVGSIRSCSIPDGYQLELIIVNDGAAPNISRYCQNQKALEVKIFPNRGSYFARNRGLEHSQGAWIGFVDADIFVDKNWIKNGVDELQKYDYVAGKIDVIRDGVSKIVADYQQHVDFNSERHMNTIHFGPTANLWIRRSLAEQVGGFNESLFSGGDMEFGRKVYSVANVKETFCEDVKVSHPPRTLAGLLRKSKRLAYGHNRMGKTSSFKSEFSLIKTLKRTLSHRNKDNESGELLLFRIFLFSHRLLYKLFYKLTKNSTEFEQAVEKEANDTQVTEYDYRVTYQVEETTAETS